MASLNPDCFEGESNPMLNNVVLQTLFEHAPLADLKNWRKVCKLWFEVSLPRWRRDVWVKVKDNRRKKDRRLFFGKYVDLILDEKGLLGRDFYQFRKYPFKRLKFENWELQAKIPKNEEDLTFQNVFWFFHGTNLTHLEIKDSTFVDFQSFPAIICRSVPNLQVLRLLGNRYPYKDDKYKDKKVDDAEWAAIDHRLMNGIKGLKELEIDMGGGSGTNCISVGGYVLLFHYVSNIKSFKLANTKDEMLLMLRKLSSDKTDEDWRLEKLDLLHIRSMRLPFLRREDCIDYFEPRFPLAELSLDIGVLTKAESFKHILQTYAVTLRKLVIYRVRGFGFRHTNGSFQYFPFDVELNKLSELWLVGAAVSRNLQFLQFIPNLKRLLLICNIGNSLMAAGSFLGDHKTMENLVNGRTWKESDFGQQNNIVADTDFRQLETLVCSQLEEFVVSGRKQGYCNPKDVAALARLMPNLKRVMIGLGNDGFRVLCHNWKELEALVVQPYALDEFGITGILPGVKNNPKLPNITDLRCLRYFGMGYETMAGIKVGLSDDSIRDGILELPNLQNLTIVCAAKVNGEMRAQLKFKFPDGKIDAEGHNILEWHLPAVQRQPSGVLPDGSDEGSSDSSDDDTSWNVIYDDDSKGSASDDDATGNEDLELTGSPILDTNSD